MTHFESITMRVFAVNILIVVFVKILLEILGPSKQKLPCKIFFPVDY